MPVSNRLQWIDKHIRGFCDGSAVKNLPTMQEMQEIGRSPGGGHGNPLQCSCLGSSKDRGTWRAGSRSLQGVGHD